MWPAKPKELPTPDVDSRGSRAVIPNQGAAAHKGAMHEQVLGMPQNIGLTVFFIILLLKVP